MNTPLSPSNPTDSQEKLSAALAYVFFLIPLLFDKKTDFVVFHMTQAFGLFLIGIITLFIPFFGWIASIILFFVMVFMMWKAYGGERFLLGNLHELMTKLIQKIGMTEIFSAK